METVKKALKAILLFLWKCFLFLVKALVFVIVCEVLIMGWLLWTFFKLLFIRPFTKKRTKFDDLWRRRYEWVASYW